VWEFLLAVSMRNHGYEKTARIRLGKGKLLGKFTDHKVKMERGV